MMRILFVCHGNICRSPAAEIVLRKLAEDAGAAMEIDSAATSTEELGNPVYPPMRRALLARGYTVPVHAARQTTRADYARFDVIVCMEEMNRSMLRRIYGGDPEGKISLLMAWAGENRPVADPWYSRDFEGALTDIERGCQCLLNALLEG